MRASRLFLTAAALTLAAATATPADIKEKNEARLAEMLKGRTAGEPVSCISAYQSDKLEVLERVGLVYKAGDTIYVARPSDPDQLRDDIIVIDRFGGQLCNTDVVRTIDRSGGFFTGVVFLGKFTPYKKD